MLSHVSLCSGIGGIDLAAEWAGFESVAVCDNNPFCQRVLAKRFPGAALYTDVKSVTAESIGKPIDLLTAGIPCQPFSVAGQRKGTNDERFIWPEVLRIIKELRPAWVVVENVKGFVSLGLDKVALDLEGAGYGVRALVLPACGVGAPHRRERTFVVARVAVSDAVGGRRQESELFGSDLPTGSSSALAHAEGGQDRRGERGILGEATSCGLGIDAAVGACREDVADASGGGLHGHDGRGAGEQPTHGHAWRTYPDGRTWATEPSVGRVAHGVPGRVDRLRALGNAVVPQQAYPILRAIADYERGER